MSTITSAGIGRSRRPLLLSRLLKVLAVRRSRRALDGLSDYLLADVGITRAEAKAEAARPIWDTPHWWRV